ncbi:helix-turn-helix transcriptional regulator [Amycolatopsis sp. MEPSY49]|uniref:helix-turn-helix transcriptional regulator n=1 Tax=Amycolatopsis sp. MEPSY49 TaxID=3151600 RepID=UPI003EF10003
MSLAEQALSEPDCLRHLGCAGQALLTLVASDNLPLADEHCARLTAMAHWRGSPAAGQVFALVRGRICHIVGDPEGALAHFGEVLESGPRGATLATAVGWLAESLVGLGRVEAAETLLAEREFAGPLPGSTPGRAQLHAARGAIAVAGGRFADGLAEYTACGRDLAARRVTNPAVVPWRAPAALAALACGDVELAKTLGCRELAAARKWGAPAGIGRALSVTALAHGGSYAADRAGEAISLLELAHARRELPRALTVHGKLLHDRNNTGGSRKQLRRAVVVARECGDRYWEGEAAAALRLVVEPKKLSRQESEVLKLASAGYSNDEIAEKLSLARRTVEFHLSSIYRKLGITGRRELPSSAELCFEVVRSAR